MTEEDKKRYKPVPFGRGFFDDWISNPFAMVGRGGKAMQEFFNEGFSIPSVDIKDTGNSFIVKADMPGMDKKDIKIKATKDELLIRAEKSSENEEHGKDYYMRERASSGYYRNIQLPGDVVPNSAKATYENGTLKIELKKAKDLQGSEVKVE
ncbi:heat shock protein Hsp20 [mine drainage metagenome]|uniref:Heat shock protein Hsp20 n=1 Tax=mine drainage metagenome TaxID=410659 RepID=T0ZMB2_9ZZZZ